MKNKTGLTAKEIIHDMWDATRIFREGLYEADSDNNIKLIPDYDCISDANFTDLSESGQATKFIIRNFLERNGYTKYRLTEEEYRKKQIKLDKTI